MRLATSLPRVCVCLLLGATLVQAGGEFFPEKGEATLNGKPCKLRRTGIAVRYKGPVRVYVVASYLREGAAAKNAHDLLNCNELKQLKLHFLIGVDGDEMAKAFLETFRGNHPAPAFNEQVGKLMDYFRKTNVKRGDHVVLTHCPKAGFKCEGPGTTHIVVEDVPFARAIWGNYLDKVNTGETVKEGLVSELP